MTDFAQLVANQYQLIRELGRGGMGVVHLARDVRLDRMVAIKVLPRELAQSDDLRTRFLREARTAAQLSHPNIVPVYQADELSGFAFFVMGFVEGELDALLLRPLDSIRRGPEAARLVPLRGQLQDLRWPGPVYLRSRQELLESRAT